MNNDADEEGMGGRLEKYILQISSNRLYNYPNRIVCIKEKKRSHYKMINVGMTTLNGTYCKSRRKGAKYANLIKLSTQLSADELTISKGRY